MHTQDESGTKTPFLIAIYYATLGAGNNVKRPRVPEKPRQQSKTNNGDLLDNSRTNIFLGSGSTTNGKDLDAYRGRWLFRCQSNRSKIRGVGYLQRRLVFGLY